MEKVTSKYPTWNRAQIEELIDTIGEDKAKMLINGEIYFEFKEVVNQFFGIKGRRIPKKLQAEICSPNQRLNLVQPKLRSEEDFDSRIERLHEFLYIDTQITGQQFKQETERLLQTIREDPLIANISSGVYLPVVLPKLSINDIGSELELYLSAVNHSYKKFFIFRKFNNYRQGNLRGEVSIANGSRHEQLIEKMKEETVIGLYFPTALQGFSVHDSREQMATLPEGFILSGMDIVIGMLMYPDVLGKGNNTLGLDLAALQWQPVESSFRFKARDTKLSFGSAGSLDGADDDFSSGLLFIG